MMKTVKNICKKFTQINELLKKTGKEKKREKNEKTI